MTLSSAGKWDYTQCHHAAAYGDDVSYRKGAAFLEGLAVEDWGCGLGWFKRFHAGRYVGIDGSKSEASDIVGDLTGRTKASPEGIFMRHVLEHNRNWEVILKNAVRAFGKRMCVVVFTPFEDKTRVLTPQWATIPDISLGRAAFAAVLWDADETVQVTVERVESKTMYGAETIFYVERAENGKGT
jgi:hypothetical protein